MTNPFRRTARAADAQPSAETMPLQLHDPAQAAVPPDAAEPGPTTSRRRRWPLIAGATAVALLATGAVAYGNARKTVQLDIDGQITTVTTFAGSVEGFLDEQEVRTGERDVVAPAVDAPLQNGSEVVVRYGRQVTVETDGKQDDIWLTALDADEALADLSSRGGDVRLVASRSATDGRPSLGLRLNTDGPVNVVADGEAEVAPDGSIGIDAILDQQGVVLEELDRIHVARDEEETPAVSLVVQRVVVEEQKKTKKIDFETVTKSDANRYEDLPTVVEEEGKKGVHTTVFSVTLVDGEEESRETLSKGVTSPPVDRVLVEGTKERPEPEPEPAPAPAASSSGSSSSGSSSSGSSSSGSSGSSDADVSSGSSGAAASGDVWAALAQCESGGNPSTNTGNGYYGMYQFSLPTWQAMGGTGLPSDASAAEQTRLAKKLQAASGWGQWPHCSSKLGLR
ncbi:resuscitation-promoting factor [Oerskovia flava]|uniref:resuscitation-promoting factor n=1 Tax=Oerskovia flava TaxID=2986422 RepID=UPI0022406AE2|nr:resuscitation-promoting factor [Oerskovia sp. JB1-3-2]